MGYMMRMSRKKNAVLSMRARAGHACVHADVCACSPGFGACGRADKRVSAASRARARTHTHTHALRARACARARASSLARACARMNARTHARAHALQHTHPRAAHRRRAQARPFCCGFREFKTSCAYSGHATRRRAAPPAAVLRRNTTLARP